MDETNLKLLALEGILRSLAYDTLGIWPSAIHGGENAYEKRTERMEGWNEALFAYTSAHYRAVKWHLALDATYRDTVTDLLIRGVLDLQIDGNVCTMTVDCSDLFVWGCSDGEGITQDELAGLNECLVLSPKHGGILWVARKRGTRPQGAYYSHIDETEWHLFDAVGPEREVGLGNPYKPGER